MPPAGNLSLFSLIVRMMPIKTVRIYCSNKTSRINEHSFHKSFMVGCHKDDCVSCTKNYVGPLKKDSFSVLSRLCLRVIVDQKHEGCRFVANLRRSCFGFRPVSVVRSN